MKYIELEATVYFWFAANATSGSGDDGASAVYDVREGGAAAGAAPTLSGSATLLSHANYPAGAYEVAIAATAANGFAANKTYGVFCTLAVDSQNPTGFIGDFTTDPIPANVLEVDGTGVDPSGAVDANLVKVLDTAITETTPGNAAGCFSEWFDENPATCGTSASVPRALAGALNGLPTVDASNRVKADLDTVKTQTVTCSAGITVSPFVGSTGAAINGTNANTLSSHDPGETIMGATDLGTGSGLTSLAQASTALSTAVWTNLLASDLGAVPSLVQQIYFDTHNDGVVLLPQYDLYHADIQFTVDEANTQDEYTITWFKNGVRQTSGITVPTIQVVKRADGTDLIASTTPTQIASTGTYKHDATTTARMTAGQAAIAVVTATIDGSTRSFSKLIGRDSE